MMWDAWANAKNQTVAGTNTVLSFNHLPGGSNLLYMDGHVEFVKFGSKYPIRALSDAEAYQPATGTYSGEVYFRGDFVRVGGQG